MDSVIRRTKWEEKLYQYCLSGFGRAKGASAWWDLLQQRGEKDFIAQGIPSRRWEAYRYTPLISGVVRPLLATSQEVYRSAPISLIMDELPGYHIVLSEGESSKATLPAGLNLLPFDSVKGENQVWLKAHLGEITKSGQDPFIAWNTASFRSGHLLHIERGVVLDRPIFLHQRVGPGVGKTLHTRMVVRMEAGSEASIVEIPYMETSQGLHTHVEETYLEPGAKLCYYLCQVAPTGYGKHFYYNYIKQGRESELYRHHITVMGSFVRNDLRVDLAGVNSLAKHYGFYISEGRGHIENKVVLAHQVPHTTSHTTYRGFTGHQSSVVFNGKVSVLPGAQQTVATQYHHGRCQDDSAQLYVRPQLAIEADEVACSHGVTVAEPSEDALFYLQARGIPAVQAERLLWEAFLDKGLAAIPLPGLRAYLEALCARKALSIFGRATEEGE